MIEHFLFGGLSAMVSRTITAPLELKKLQMQNNYLKHQSVKYVIRNEGIRFLWKGNMTNCVRVFPQYAINFMCFEKFQKLYLNIFDNKLLTNFIAGGSSGIISMTTTYPLETARTHLSLQVNKSNYNSLFDVFKKLNTRELYAGLRMSMFGFALGMRLILQVTINIKKFLKSMKTIKIYISYCVVVQQELQQLQ